MIFQFLSFIYLVNNALEKERSRAVNCSYVIAFEIVRMKSLYLTYILARKSDTEYTLTTFTCSMKTQRCLYTSARAKGKAKFLVVS